MSQPSVPPTTPDTRAYDAAVEKALSHLHLSIERSFDDIRVAIVTMLDQLVAAGRDHIVLPDIPAAAVLTPDVLPTDTCH